MIAYPWCQHFLFFYNNHWRSRFPLTVRILFSSIGYAHKAKQIGVHGKGLFHSYFPYCLFSGNKQKASVFKIAFTIVYYNFLIPILDCRILFCGSQCWGSSAAKQRPHKPCGMWMIHVMSCELHGLHSCFPKESTWCDLKGPVLYKFWFSFKLAIFIQLS